MTVSIYWTVARKMYNIRQNMLALSPKITLIKRKDSLRTVFKITALNLAIYGTATTCDKVLYVSWTGDLCIWKSNSRIESYS